AYDIAVGTPMGHDRGVWSQDSSDQRGQPFKLTNDGGCVIAVDIYMPPLAIVIYLSLWGALG
ncbi:MAG: hypothetical protein MUQ50_00910, partial [Paracoccaceae bacterium]|nr:hypothetical protein [Paracoccaceae bacterium]